MSRLRVALVVTNSSTNYNDLYQNAIEDINILAKKYDFDFIPYKDQLKTSEDGENARKFVEDNKIDFLIIYNVVFSNGWIYPPLLKNIKARVGLWAIQEVGNSGPITTLSFLGINNISSIIGHYLKDYKIKTKWFYGRPGDDLFDERFRVTIKALQAIKKMDNSKVGLIGGIARGFDGSYFDERTYAKIWGVKIYRWIEFSDIKKIEASLKQKEIDKEIKKIKSEIRNSLVSDDEINMASRVFLAVKNITQNEKYDAIALSCWPKFQEEYNIAVCSTISRLNEYGIATGCEGDLPGAISMLLLNYLNNDRSMLNDLLDFDEKDQTLEFWHCGPAAMRWANSEGVSLGKHPTLAGNTGCLNCMSFKKTDATIMRISGEGEKAFLLNADSLDNKKLKFTGASGWFGNTRINDEKVSIRDVINTILVSKLQHHYPIAKGNLYKELMEVFGWLGIEPIKLVPYKSYIQ